MKKISFILILLLTFCQFFHSQCNVTITPSLNPVTCSGTNVSLVAVGSGTTIAVLDNDFDSGSAGAGWNLSPAGQFNNPCDPSIDGGLYMWMGPTTTAPRSLETAPLDVSCGGEVCFWLDFAEQCFGCSSPCEGPDLSNEGVYFEYSIDGGNTWTTINYFEPNTNGSFNSSSPGSGDYTTWAQYCYIIPPAAQTTTTIFQWWQDGATSANYDHWGIDNVEINASSCSSFWYDWSHVSGTTGPIGDSSTLTVFVDTDTTFVVSYTDGVSFNCTDTVDITFSGITLSSTTVDNTCHNTNGSCDGSATVLQTGGQGTITYQWYNTVSGLITGANTSTLSSACAGDYYVDVSDQFCTATEYVTINEPSAMSFTSSTIDESCTLSNGSIDLTPNGGNGIINYNINGGASQTSTSFNNLQAGAFLIEMQDANLCTFSSNISLINQPPPTFDSAHFNDPTCVGTNDGSIEIFANGNGSSVLYSIDGGNSYQNTNLFSWLPSGTYSVYLSNVNNCVVFGVIDSLSSPFPINIISSTVDALCSDSCDGSIDLTLSNGGLGTLTYSIDGGVTFSNNAIFNNLCADIYSLQINDANNCSAVLLDTINEPPALSTIIQFTDPSCYGFSDASVTLTPTGGTAVSNYNISWMGGPSSGLTFFNNLTSGTYNFSLSDDNGCYLDSSVILTDPIPITIDTILIAPENCAGDCLGSVEINSPFAIGYSVQGPQSYFGLVPFFDSLCSGTYTIIVENSFGCQDSTSIDITSPPALIVDTLSDTIVCIGGTASLFSQITGGTGNISYNWSNGYIGDTLIVSPSSDSLFYLFGQDDNGCISDTLFSNVQLYDSLFLILNTDTTICFNDTLMIQAVVSGGIGTDYTYNWNNSLSDTSTHFIVPTLSNTYTLNVSDGCETPAITDSFNVLLNPVPEPIFNADQLSGCIPLEVQFNEQFSSPNGSCYWEFGDGGTNSVNDTVNHIFNVPGCWDIYLEYTDSLGCKRDTTYNDYICSYGYPVPNFFYNPTDPTLTNNFVSFYNSSSIDAVNFLWEIGVNGSLGVFNQENIDYSFSSDIPDQYLICLTVSNIEGCESDTCLTVNVKDNFIFYAPNAFSPDGDNINDSFGPIVYGVAEYSYRMYIFNRWGELIYESYNENIKWDGTNYNDNKISPPGVYVWKIELFDDINNEVKTYIGNVNLVK